MLVNWGSAIQPVWTKCQVQGFQNCRLPRIVITEQNGMLGEKEGSLFDASEVLDMNVCDLHELIPFDIMKANVPRLSLR